MAFIFTRTKKNTGLLWEVVKCNSISFIPQQPGGFIWRIVQTTLHTFKGIYDSFPSRTEGLLKANGGPNPYYVLDINTLLGNFVMLSTPCRGHLC